MQTRVYRNLNNGKWSLQQKTGGKWLVVGYCDACLIMNVMVRQSEAARQKVITNQRRSVHCWVTGDLVSVTGLVVKDGRGVAHQDVKPGHLANYRRVTYNPYKHRTLVYADDESEYAGSLAAEFTARHHMYVSMESSNAQ